MNKVILMGRLTREPEVRYSNGAEPLAVAHYTLAVNRRFKRKDEPGCTAKKDAGGEADFAKQSAERADFIPCVAFGKSGEFAEKYFRKGQLVAVTGRLQVRSWDKDGENAGQQRLSLRSSTLRKVRRTAEKASLRHRASLRRRPENRWG